MNLAKVDASQKYTSMMRRLAIRPTHHRIPIIDDLSDAYSYYSRRLNKYLGRPPTPDVGTLSKLISQLRVETEALLGSSIRVIVVTRPHFDALTDEDLNEAIEYVGLQDLLGPRFPSNLAEMSAAFAANGNGLCDDYTNEDSCDDDVERMPLHQVFAVTYVISVPTSLFFVKLTELRFDRYTENALYVTLAPIRDAFILIDDRHHLDFTAGLNHLRSYPNVSDYWQHVQSQLTQLSRSASGWARRPITKVLLLGESVKEPEFLLVLREALADVSRLPTYINPSIKTALASVAFDPPTMADPLYAAARGAAEYAKRILNGPRGCFEPKHCRENEQNATIEMSTLVEF